MIGTLFTNQRCARTMEQPMSQAIANWLRLDGDGQGTFTAPWQAPAEGWYRIGIADDRGHEIATQAYLTPEMRVLSAGGWFDQDNGMRVYTGAEFTMSSGESVATDIDPERVTVEWHTS